MKSSSVLPCWASACRTVLEHQEGELEELGEQLDDEDGGLNLGVDALHKLATGLLMNTDKSTGVRPHVEGEPCCLYV